MIYLVDIDGTIADLSHRLHFIQEKPANWDGFFAACPADKPIVPVLDVIKSLQGQGHDMMFVTGRSSSVKDETAKWLNDNDIWPTALYMRKAGDHRPDNIVKSELLDSIIEEFGAEDIAAAFEDRNQVVQMYRERGITVFQVADGNF
jgi:hydroxymethylpyrimidine pyrophosphatase-like HAD family hydrolase